MWVISDMSRVATSRWCFGLPGEFPHACPNSLPSWSRSSLFCKLPAWEVIRYRETDWLLGRWGGGRLGHTKLFIEQARNKSVQHRQVQAAFAAH